MAEFGPIPVIGGPTGSGKTSVAVKLAAEFDHEAVSADSRQIFKYLDIGTAKPTAEEQAALPTHLIDTIEPGVRYSAYRFIEDCDTAISDILGRGKIPLVVGGTGLYLRALTDGVIEIDQDRPELRERLETEMDRLGPEEMHHRLAAVDPDEAERVHPNNRVRVIRALEIFELTGRPKSKLVAEGAYKKSRHSYVVNCLIPERAGLYDRINSRVDTMMKNSLLDEVDRLVATGWKERLRTANVIGYVELLDYREGKLTLDEAVAMIKQNSRRYAKRQITWFRHLSDSREYDNPGSLRDALRIQLNRVKNQLKT